MFEVDHVGLQLETAVASTGPTSTILHRSLAVAIALLLATTAGCETAESEPTAGIARDTTVAAPSTTVATMTTDAAATSSTTITTTTTTTSTTAPPTTLPAVTELDAGLFCRDLVAMGYDYANSVTYWIKEGSPDRMDADRNGIPCETVYAGTDVVAFWGSPLPTTTVATIGYEPDDPMAALSRFPDPVHSAADGHGSGCAPGMDSLPDGIWFGYVTARLADRLDFDLACVWTGEAAARKAEEAGKEDLFGYWIGNDSDKIRSPGIASNAVVYHLTLDPFFTILTFDDWRQEVCHGTQDHECPVWLYVNGGKVTAIVEQFFA